MAKNDGGPAFPAGSYVQYEGPPNKAVPIQHMASPGMSLRDWFAGMALQGMLASGHEDAIEKTIKKLGGSPSEGLAAASYGFANAMLAAREKD